MNKKLKIGLGLLFLVLLLGSIFMVYAETCSGDSCILNSTNNSVNARGYTYTDNMKDSKCFYNLNFCNLHANGSTTNSDANGVINVLKQVNYQMQDDLNACKVNSNITKNIILIIAVLAVLWATYVTLKFRKYTHDQTKQSG